MENRGFLPKSRFLQHLKWQIYRLSMKTALYCISSGCACSDVTDNVMVQAYKLSKKNKGIQVSEEAAFCNYSVSGFICYLDLPIFRTIACSFQENRL